MRNEPLCYVGRIYTIEFRLMLRTLRPIERFLLSATHPRSAMQTYVQNAYFQAREKLFLSNNYFRLDPTISISRN